jgi:hypothetical protein
MSEFVVLSLFLAKTHDFFFLVSLAASSKNMSDEPQQAGPGAEIQSSAPVDNMACLLCSNCRWPLLSESQILRERAPVGSSVYPYELELLGREAWLYSVTEADGSTRYDMIRCNQTVGDTIMPNAEYDSRNTWFSGHDYSISFCMTCGQHIGWSYSRSLALSHGATEGGTRRNVAFFCVIVTKCIPSETFSRSRFDEAVRTAPQRFQEFRVRKAVYQQLKTMLDLMEDRRAANIIASHAARLDQAHSLTTEAIIAYMTEAVNQQRLSGGKQLPNTQLLLDARAWLTNPGPVDTSRERIQQLNKEAAAVLVEFANAVSPTAAHRRAYPVDDATESQREARLASLNIRQALQRVEMDRISKALTLQRAVDEQQQLLRQEQALLLRFSELQERERLAQAGAHQ